MAEPIATAPISDAPVTPRDQSANSFTDQSPRKRRRSSKQYSATSPEPKSVKSALSPRFTPALLTGAAGLLDEKRAREEHARIEARQQSPNPARQALGDLLALQSGGMSTPKDAPKEAPTLSEPLAEVASSIHIPSAEGQAQLQNSSTVHTSPQSTASFRTLDSTPVATITANGASVASPGQFDEIQGNDNEGQGQDVHHQAHDDANSADPDEGRSLKAFTYPGPILSAQAHRTQSLPQSGFGAGRDGTRSPSTKRHKCPYCSTDFTRHHNLKSHLLTHSHEKPYRCDTCEASFRRLHDLKRHTKLHTGERPHVCPKCDRSFARGDALARHNKGQGGCAGRRSSMGSFVGDDKHEDRMRAGDGDSMTGIMYTGEASHEPEHMDEDTESPSGRSLPSIRKHDAPEDSRRYPQDQPSIYQSRQPSTYPPVAARPPTGGLYPPTASPRGGSISLSAHQSPLAQTSFPPSSSSTTSFQAPGSNVFAQGGITESPKPLSPAGMASHQLGHPESGIRRNRSPSLTQQLQQQQFGRRPTGHNTSPSMSLPPPPPHLSATHSNAPQLPSLPGLNPPEPRFTLQSQAPGPSQLHSPVTSTFHQSAPGSGSPGYPPGNISSANNSLSSHSTGPHTSFDRTHNAFAQPNEQLWAYIRGIEVKLDRLQDEVMSLKMQISQQHQQQPQQPR